MTSRDRIFAAVNQKRPDRTPLDGDFREDIWAKLENHFGTEDSDRIKAELGLDIRYASAEPGPEFKERAVPSPSPILDIGVGRKNLVIQTVCPQRCRYDHAYRRYRTAGPHDALPSNLAVLF